MTILLVGQGLLGRAVARRLRRLEQVFQGVTVTWTDRETALGQLLRATDDCVAASEPTGWDLMWCAGAGVVGSSEGALRDEGALLQAFLDRLAVPPRATFLASSAGGLYAGSDGPPFTEQHEPRPVSAYGRAKLAAEEACLAFTQQRGTRVAIGRFSNLYGPEQDLGKPQGLLSQLCLARVVGRPVQIFVPMDTLRDYIYADDAAAVAVAMLDRVGRDAEGTAVIKIVGSGQAVSISGLVAASTKAFRRRVPVVQTVVEGTGQVRDLRLRTTVWTDLDALVGTPLVVGIRATAEGVAWQHRAATSAVTSGRRTA